MPLITDITNVAFVNPGPSIPGTPTIPAVAAVARLGINANAAGDGTVGITIDAGAPITFATGVGQSPSSQALELIDLINTDATYTATQNGGNPAQIDLVDNTAGVIGNGRIIADVSTDTSSGVSEDISPNGGVDEIPGTAGTPGSNGYYTMDLTSLSIVGFVAMAEWVTGDSAILRRELDSVGWQLDGLDAGKLFGKAETVATHILTEAFDTFPSSAAPGVGVITTAAGTSTVPAVIDCAPSGNYPVGVRVEVQSTHSVNGAQGFVEFLQGMTGQKFTPQELASKIADFSKGWTGITSRAVGSTVEFYSFPEGGGNPDTFTIDLFTIA